MKKRRTKHPGGHELAEAGDLLQLQATALEVATNPIVITRRDGNIIWVNRAFEQLSGYTKDEALGQSANLLRSGQHPASLYKSMWDTILSGQKWRGELVNRRKDGSLYHEEMSITPVNNDTGEITHFIAIKSDITERKRTEERICLLAQAVENSGDLIAITDCEGCVLVVNQALLQATEYVESEVLGRFFGSTLLSPNNPPNFNQQLLACTLSGAGWRGECLSRRKDGTDFPTFVSTGQIRDNQGHLVGLYGISQDITERKQADELRRLAEERFNKAFHASPVGICISTKAQGLFLEVNEAFAQLLEYEPGELIGAKSLDVGMYVQPADRARLVELLSSGVPVRDFKLELRTKSGKIRGAQLAAEPLEVHGVDCILSLIRNTTEQELLERQLRQAHRMEAVGSLAAGVAHDFNNVLGVILGNMELLSERIPPDEIYQKYLERVRMAVNSATAVTRQLLAFSRQQILQPVILDLNAAVQQLNKMTQRLIGENIRVVLSLEPDLGLVKADPGQIEQVLMNLVVNARDAMPQGGKLFIKTASVCLDQEFVNHHIGSKLGDFTKLSVTDTGVGMNKDVLTHIFEPFFTTKEVGKGTGLGLATVYGIVKQSEGYI
ncbi:MAG: PAS domain S-box protein, partial [Candidatus Acidiferrum sp.]